ncbi:MAG: thioredoxin family protein [Sulfuricurvum sp.]|nr:thioredoxin family protein [Sulfuricurvum sp.]
MQKLEKIQNTLQANDAVMLYFSAPSCGVCHVLKPKLSDAIMGEFLSFKIESIDISETPDISSYYSVFTVPTVLIFFEGREFLRKSRNMSVVEITDAIRRPYNLMVGS